MNIKKFALFIAMGALFNVTNASDFSDADIMTINGKGIKKAEFEYIYSKNAQQQIGHKTLAEYILMFRDYKLKVLEAEAAGIDTTAAFISELAGYRNQLSKPYLVDNLVEENLIKEAYSRLKEDVEVAHILIQVDVTDTNKTKEKSYEKAMSLAKKARNGEDFGKLAVKYSEDKSAEKNGGYLGFIKGFATVYPFECAAYNTEVGKISDPILSRFGYHIVKVISRRPDPGEVKTAHIMMLFGDSITKEEKKEKEAKIQEAYSKLQNGADFAAIVKEYSEDSSTRDTDGVLPWISSGRMIKEYEDVAFSLKEPGDISKPFESPYGLHIVKLLEKRGLKPLEEMQSEIKRRISRDERASQGEKSLIEKLKIEYDYNFNGEKMSELKDIALKLSPSDTLFINQIKDDDSVLFTLDGKRYSVSEFAAYLDKNKNSTLMDNVEILNDKVNSYIDYTIISYESTRLTDKYPDFRNLMNEYRDGMMLFEICNRQVWNKASQDTNGLKRYFKKNKKNYSWKEPRFKGYSVKCINDSIASIVKKDLKKLSSDSAVYKLNNKFNIGAQRQIIIKKSLFSFGDNSIVDYISYHSGKAPIDEKYPVYFVKGKMLKKGPEEYSDVKGQVIADYQNELEKEWVSELNKKYKVVINEEVLSTVKER